VRRLHFSAADVCFRSDEPPAVPLPRGFSWRKSAALKVPNMVPFGCRYRARSIGVT